MWTYTDPSGRTIIRDGEALAPETWERRDDLPPFEPLKPVRLICSGGKCDTRIDHYGYEIEGR